MTNKNNDKGDMTVSEAGKKGGEARKKELGREGYQALGHKGGVSVHEKHPNLAHEAGKKGGQRVSELVEKGKKA